MDTPNVPNEVAIQYAIYKEAGVAAFLQSIYPDGFTFEEVVKNGEWISHEDIETFKYNGQEVFSVKLVFTGHGFMIKLMHGNYHE